MNESVAQTFVNVTDSSGIEMPHSANKMSTGIAVADFDNNGLDDLFMTGYDLNSLLFFNQGNGQFQVNLGWSMPDFTAGKCGSVVAADYNNDGNQDLYVACLGRNYLLKNNGSGFEDVTSQSGTDHDERTEAVAWGDINQDGWLDLLVGVHPLSLPVNPNDPDDFDKILLNNGDDTFTVMAHNIPLAQIGKATLAVSFTDIDLDGDLDIYILNDRYHGNVLLINEGSGCGDLCFTDISVSTGADRPADSMGIAIADYDLDGDWDLSYSSIDEHIFLKNTGTIQNPVFDDQMVSISPFPANTSGWGTLMFDAENDGYEDLYVATQHGFPDPSTNFFFSNQGNGLFSDNTTAAGLIEPTGSQAAAWLDFNADGKLDLVYGRYNDLYQLIENTTDNTNNWLGLKLKGEVGFNRDAIGSVVMVELSDGRHLIRELRSGESRGSNNAKLIHFGIGNASVEEIKIRWPNQDTQRFNWMPINTYSHITYTGPDSLFTSGFE